MAGAIVSLLFSKANDPRTLPGTFRLLRASSTTLFGGIFNTFRNPWITFLAESDRLIEFGFSDDTVAGANPTRTEIIESRAENLRALEIRFRSTSSSLNLSANTTSESKKRRGKGMGHDKYSYVSTVYYSYKT